MKKIIIAAWLLSLIMFTIIGCGKSAIVNTNQTEATVASEKYIRYSMDGGVYSIPKSWREKVDTETLKYYYPEDGMLMISFYENAGSIEDEAFRKSYIDSFSSGMEKCKLISESEISVAGTKAYRHRMNVENSGKEFECYLVTFDYDHGIFSFLMYSLSGSDKDHSNEFNNILDSIKLTDRAENPSISETTTTNIISDTNPVSCFSYSGSGDDVVTGLTTNEKYSFLRFTSSSDGHKAIKAHYEDDYDLLLNTTDSYSGNTLLHPNREYSLEVVAGGNWTIEVFDLGKSSKDSFVGYGDYITPLFLSSSDVYEIVANGDGHFAVKGYYGYDQHDYELLVNTTDPYTGKVMFGKEGEYCFFEVVGERDFTINPVN